MRSAQALRTCLAKASKSMPFLPAEISSKLFIWSKVALFFIYFFFFHMFQSLQYNPKFFRFLSFKADKLYHQLFRFFFKFPILVFRHFLFENSAPQRGCAARRSSSRRSGATHRRSQICPWDGSICWGFLEKKYRIIVFSSSTSISNVIYHSHSTLVFSQVSNSLSP